MKCEDESQVQMHLESLMQMQEQLIGMTVGLADADLIMVILGSLPKSYCPLINAITMSAAHAKVNLKPDNVIENILRDLNTLLSKMHNSRPEKMPWQQLGTTEKRVRSPMTTKATPPNPTILRLSAGIAAKRDISEGIAVL